jgi:methyl-accepting chemotaxis protein
MVTLDASKSMRDVAVATRANAEAASDMKSGTNMVSQTIMGVAAVSEQSAAGAEELTAGVHEVGQAARELEGLGNELQVAVRKFRLEGDVATRPLKLAA